MVREGTCEYELIRTSRASSAIPTARGRPDQFAPRAVPEPDSRVTLTSVNALGLRKVSLHWAINGIDNRTIRTLGMEPRRAARSTRRGCSQRFHARQVQGDSVCSTPITWARPDVERSATAWSTRTAGHGGPVREQGACPTGGGLTPAVIAARAAPAKHLGKLRDSQRHRSAATPGRARAGRTALLCGERRVTFGLPPGCRAARTICASAAWGRASA
jgi:hypothetical protein